MSDPPRCRSPISRSSYVPSPILRDQRPASAPGLRAQTVYGSSLHSLGISTSSCSRPSVGSARRLRSAASSPIAPIRERPRPASTENFYSEHEVLRMIQDLHAEKVRNNPILKRLRTDTILKIHYDFILSLHSYEQSQMYCASKKRLTI